MKPPAQPIIPEGWSRPAGYAHGMTARGTVVTTAGMVGWNPVTEEFEHDDFAGQAAQALRNIIAVVAAAGGKPHDVVRLTWYILDKDEYTRARKPLGAAYREILGPHFPAMTVVVVSGLLEPAARLEIEATAVLP
jgi:enamine deaminase RidA (YjgF/YER057c/UK114 family)